MIDHSRQIIFIHLEGVGGTDLTHVCVGREEEHKQESEGLKHLNIYGCKLRYSEFFDYYTKFTVLRHPYDRYGSIRRRGWLSEWVTRNNRDLNNQFYLSDRCEEELKGVRIFNYEDPNELNEFLSIKNIPYTFLPSSEKYELSGDERSLVAKLCKTEFKLGNYDA